MVKRSGFTIVRADRPLHVRKVITKESKTVIGVISLQMFAGYHVSERAHLTVASQMHGGFVKMASVTYLHATLDTRTAIGIQMMDARLILAEMLTTVETAENLAMIITHVPEIVAKMGAVEWSPPLMIGMSTAMVISLLSFIVVVVLNQPVKMVTG